MTWKCALAIGLATASLGSIKVEPVAAATLPHLSLLQSEVGAAELVRHRGGGGVRFYGGGTRYYGYGYGYRPVVPYTYYYGAPVVSYYGGYATKCSWLRHKARETGSRYWWRRYREEC